MVKIKIKHNKCNTQYKVTPNSFLCGKRCPQCYGKNKKSHENFLKEVKLKVGEEYSILDKYINANTKIKIRHNICNHEWEATPHSFLRGSRCPKCNGGIKSNHKDFLEKVYNLYNEEYLILGEYKNASTKLKVRHNKCECKFEWEITPNNLLRGYGCPKCANNVLKTTEKFQQEIYSLVKDEYSLLDDYINAFTKVKIKHNICLSTYFVTPHDFLCGNRCPICKEFKGEKNIRKFLILNKIDFISQKKFEDLLGVGNGNLSYDFYLPQYNLLIEYQGEQHYKPVDFHGFKENEAVEQFKKQQIHDQCKREYAKNNNINLLEIPYWDFNNIEEILIKNLKL